MPQQKTDIETAIMPFKVQQLVENKEMFLKKI